MRRFSSAIAAAAVLVIPLSALALAGNPAALLKQMTFKGNPHSVEAEFHVHHEDTHVSLWIKGASEGKTPAAAKGWEDLTLDISANGDYLRARGAVRLVNGKIYMKLESIEGDIDADLAEIRAWTEKPWVEIDLPETAVEQATFAAAFAAGLRNSNIEVSEEDVHALVDAVADALFTMETTRFQGGAAYSLKLAPDYLHRTIAAIESSTIGQQIGFDGDDVDLLEDLPVNLHIRVNTNAIGELTFVKWYAATDINGASLVMQGNSQWQGHSVNVEIPKDTVPLEELTQDLENSYDLPSWGDVLDEGVPMPEEETDEWDMKIPEEEVTKPARVVPQEIQRIRLEVPRRTPDCTATPGTPFYLQQARKGICTLPSRTEYRVNHNVLNQNIRPSGYYWR
ncbi:MAG: hypothetical protein AAB544_03210 [Patescibacteria group bacterium]